MRGMLVRAAEIRDSEQQQIFDSLDEIHARLAALDALGTVRKRLTELPDRAEVSVLAERLDETLAKIDAQDTVLAALTRAVEALPDRMARPIDAARRPAGRHGRAHGGRRGPDGRAGRPARRAAQAPRRPRQPARPAGDAAGRDALLGRRAGPGAHRGGRARGPRAARRAAARTADEGLRTLLGETGAGLHRAAGASWPPGPRWTRPSRWTALARRLEALAERLDQARGRRSAARLGTLGGSIEEKFGQLDAALERRPDSDSLRALVGRANEESERRNAGQLDEAMATFAELILGRGGSMPAPPPRPAPGRSAAAAARSR